MTTQQTDPQNQQQQEPQQEPQQQPQNEPATQATEPDEETKKLANEQLRTYADSVAEENKQLRSLAMRSALSEIGLTPEEGLGLAIVETYDGSITDEDIANYAAEKYKHGAQQQPQQDPAVAAAQRAEQLAATGQSVEPRPQTTPGQQASQKVDGNDPEADRQEAVMSTTEKVNEFLRQHYPAQQ